MEYRCLIVGDPIVEPGALLRRLLHLDFPHHEARQLRRQSLRDMRDLETKLLSTPESVDDARSSLAGTTSSLRAEGPRKVMCVSMPSPDACTLRLPNPSIPSVDITVRFRVVTEPRDVLRALGLSRTTSSEGLPSSSWFSGSHADASQEAATATAYHAGMMPHAVVAVFNPFARRSFSKMRVEWRYFLSALSDARETRSSAGHNATHNAGSAVLARDSTFAGFTAIRKTEALQQTSSALPLSPSTKRLGFGLVDGRGGTPMSPLSPYDVSPGAPRGPSGIYESHGDPSLASPVLLVGTRFEFMREAIEATPSVSMPTSTEVWELAVALNAKAYSEVGTYWDDTFDELRLTIARACVGELSHSPVVRAPLVFAARQTSVVRSLEEAEALPLDDEALEERPVPRDVFEAECALKNDGDHGSLPRDGGSTELAAPREPSEKDLSVAIDTSGTSGHSHHGAADKSGAAFATTKEDSVARGERGGVPALVPAAEVPMATSPHAEGAEETMRRKKGSKSQWTWRRHPQTQRIFFVHRASRRSQYERPEHYDGKEPDSAVPSKKRHQPSSGDAVIDVVRDAAVRTAASEPRSHADADAAAEAQHPTNYGASNSDAPQRFNHSLPCVLVLSDEEKEEAGADRKATVDSDAPILRPPLGALPPLHPPQQATTAASSDMVGQVSAPPFPTAGAAHTTDLVAASTTAASRYEQELAQQRSQKQAYLTNLRREVALLREKQHVLRLQQDQNAKLSALFDRTHHELVEKQMSFQAENDAAMTALQTKATRLEEKLRDLMDRVPASVAPHGDKAAQMPKKDAPMTELGAAPSFLFTPEEWTVIQHATAAEKEQLLLERAVHSTAEQLRRTLSDVDVAQQKARDAYGARETAAVRQRDAQAAVDALLAHVAEQEAREAALQDALRVVQREKLQASDALRTQRLLVEQLQHMPSPLATLSPRPESSEAVKTQAGQVDHQTAAVSETERTLTTVDARITQIRRRLEKLLSRASISPLTQSSASAEDDETDALCTRVQHWLQETARHPPCAPIPTHLIGAALVQIGQDAFRISRLWRHLLTLSGSVQASDDRRDAPSPPNESGHRAKGEIGNGVLRDGEAGERVSSLAADARSIAEALEQAAVACVCVLDHQFAHSHAQNLAHASASETFMRRFWWLLLTLCAEHVVASRTCDPLSSVSVMESVQALASDMDRVDSDFRKALKAAEAVARTDTHTET